MKKKESGRLKGAAFIGMLFFAAASFININAVGQSDTATVTIQQILDAHNAYRNEVGVPALTWSNDLAQFAQSWANELATNRGCVLQHRPNDESDPWNQKYGENIYAAGGTDWSPTVLDGIADWGTEKSDFDFDTKECKNGAVCGHYTQMIWKSTTMVGCGIAKCPGGNVIVVCNYNPPGNYVGEKPY
jgi:pathogenesis-related protein 1